MLKGELMVWNAVSLLKASRQKGRKSKVANINVRKAKHNKAEFLAEARKQKHGGKVSFSSKLHSFLAFSSNVVSK